MSRTSANACSPGLAELPAYRAWLQMLRPPNLFTVPGDPLAGYVLAAAAIGDASHVRLWQIVLAASCSLLLYAGGLLQNDYFDLAEDRRQRPDRPLPARQANPRTVLVVAFALALTGVAAAAVASPASGLIALILLVAMTAYNIGVKRVQLVGPLMMGACRGLSLLIGAGLAGGMALQLPAVALSAASLTAFIAAVTLVASRETETIRPGWRRWGPSLILAVWLGALLVMWPPEQILVRCIAAALGAWAVLWTVLCAHALKGRPEPAIVQRTIGRFIGGLLFIQAALAAHQPVPGLLIAVGLLAVWPLSRRTARWFYAS